MMLAMLAAAATVATQPAPPATTAPAGQAARPPAQELSLEDQLNQLNNIYDQSCGDRGYGSFEDACRDMRKRVRELEKTIQKQAKQEKQAKNQP